MSKAREFFSPPQAQALEQAIREAELLTSGEIRIHVEDFCDDPFERGKTVFANLQMDATEEKNGVLFYLAVESRKFAVLGDIGIHERVGQEFWDRIRDAMVTEFKKGDFVAGLKFGVLTAGRELSDYFPRSPNDKNELPDAISFGDEDSGQTPRSGGA